MSERRADMVRCARCGETRPLAEFRPHDRTYPNGRTYRIRRSYCLDCWRAKVRESHDRSARRRGVKKLIRLGLTATHKECCVCRRMLPHDQFYVAAKGRGGLGTVCRDCNRERGRARPMVVYNHTRRARRLAGGTRYTLAEWRALLGQCAGRCLACGAAVKLTPDHVVPLSAGGSNSIDNIQPLCGPCNSRKGGQTIDYRQAIRT